MNKLEKAGLLKELLAAKNQIQSATGLGKAKLVAAILDLRKRLQMQTPDKAGRAAVLDTPKRRLSV